MNIQEKTLQSFQISQEKLLAVVRAVAGARKGREDDDHPLPPGPWDPVIRRALEHVSLFGPHPEPWWSSSELLKLILESTISRRPEIIDAIKPHSLLALIELNPQPLPPRHAFLASLARTVIDRAELIEEIIDTTCPEGEQQGIIIVSGYLARFTDDSCGNEFRLRWPFPNPPPFWFVKEFDGVDLLMMAAQFDQAATEAFNPSLRQSLTNASAKFAETGLSRMK